MALLISQTIDNEQITISHAMSFVQTNCVQVLISRNTRQIIAYVIGDRSELTFRRLIRKIPIEYLKSQIYSDYGETPSQILRYFKSKRKSPKRSNQSS